jgi:hypothetical protein
MKLHELDWTDGTQYEMGIKGTLEIVSVVTKDHDLYSLDGVDISGEFTLKSIVTAEFTEVFEEVTFLEAYQNCLAYGYKYKSKGGVHNINMHRDIDGNVCLLEHNTILLNLDKQKWVRIK